MCVAGCGKDEAAETESAVKPVADVGTEAAAETESAAESLTGAVKEAVEAGAAELSDQLMAKLAEADKFDGEADKVIKKCAGCGLKMDGKSEHAFKVAGYTIHFCEAACMEEFTKDLAKSIEGMEIPEP
jgi:hypothetical protein